MKKMIPQALCPNCNAKLTYEGEMAAPGYGKCWKCDQCGHSYVQIGGTYIDTADVDPDEGPPWVMDDL